MSRQQLKILWLSHLIPYPPKGGVLMRSHYLLTELARHHQVDLIAFNQRALINAYFSSQDEGLQQAHEQLGKYINKQDYLEIPSEVRPAGKYITAGLSLFSKAPYTINWLKSQSFEQALKQALARTDYDLIHYDTISLAPYRQASLNIPCVLDHHNIESHMLLRRAEQEANPIKRWYFGQEGRRLLAYEKTVLPAFRHHITCSEDDRSRLLEMAPTAACSVIPNGIMLPDSPIAWTPEDPPRLLFIGGLSWYPNRDAMEHFLGHIWPIIRSTHPSVCVDIIGKNPSKAIMAHAENDTRVRVHGYVDDIRPYYAKASAYICPIRDGGGTKLKILDAMAHGTPIVAYDIACEGIHVTPGEDVLIADNQKDFAEKTCALIADRELGRKLSTRCVELSKASYDVRSIGKRLADLYAGICEQHSVGNEPQ